MTQAEKKDIVLRKIKLQLYSIGTVEEDKKYGLVSDFFAENIRFLYDNIHEDFYFDSVLKLMREIIPEDCVEAEYAYKLVVYQAYRWGNVGNKEKAEQYIDLVDLATSTHFYPYRCMDETGLLLLCATAMCRGTERFHLEIMEKMDDFLSVDEEDTGKVLYDLELPGRDTTYDNHIKINILLGYAEGLKKVSRYEDALEYCEKAMEIVGAMSTDTLRAAFECEILLLMAEVKGELFQQEEAFCMLKSCVEIIDNYPNTTDSKALQCFACAYAKLGGLAEEEEKGRSYMEKCLILQKRLYELVPNDFNKKNLAITYIRTADFMKAGDERVTIYYEEAIAALRELYQKKKEHENLDEMEEILRDWIYAMLAAFEKTQNERYITTCQLLLETEYKQLIVCDIQKERFKSAKPMLEHYADMICKVYGEPYLGSRSYEELEWQRAQLAAME